MTSSAKFDDATLLFEQLDKHGLKLPDYIIKLLLLTGYDNLYSIARLRNYKFIDDLEEYGTEFLEPTDLGLSDSEQKYYFSKKTGKFRILPGHKHLLTEAGNIAEKHTCRSEETDEHDFDLEKTLDAEHVLDESIVEQRISSEQLTNDELRYDCHGLVEKTEIHHPKEPYPVAYSPESERESLARFIGGWLERKIRGGNLTTFVYEVDYRVLVYRPKSSNPMTQMDIFLFVCHRCNTTIKVFKRRNGNSWNAANVYRHISTVHFNPESNTIPNISLESTSIASQDGDLSLSLNSITPLKSKSIVDQDK